MPNFTIPQNSQLWFLTCPSTCVIQMKISSCEGNIYAILTTLWYLTRQEQAVKKNDFINTIKCHLEKKTFQIHKYYVWHFSNCMGFCCEKGYLISQRMKCTSIYKQARSSFTQGNVKMHLLSVSHCFLF